MSDENLMSAIRATETAASDLLRITDGISDESDVRAGAGQKLKTEAELLAATLRWLLACLSSAGVK